MTFYDSKGKPVAYLHDDGIHIYLFNGKPVAYFHGDAVYGFNGHQFGWFENGWIRDKKGYCVFFTEDACGGPLKPLKALRPLKSMKTIKPIKSLKQMRVMKPMKVSSWSILSNERFFEQ